MLTSSVDYPSTVRVFVMQQCWRFPTEGPQVQVIFMLVLVASHCWNGAQSAGQVVRLLEEKLQLAGGQQARWTTWRKMLGLGMDLVLFVRVCFFLVISKMLQVSTITGGIEGLKLVAWAAGNSTSSCLGENL